MSLNTFRLAIMEKERREAEEIKKLTDEQLEELIKEQSDYYANRPTK